MKRLISPKLILFLLLSCLNLFACDCGEKIEDVFPRRQSEGDKSKLKEAPPSGDLAWAEVPAYPGATRVKKAVSTPVLKVVRSEYKKVEFRYYKTTDAEEKVASFYLVEMPKRSWKKVMSMDFGGLSFLSSWQRNGGGIGVTITTLKEREDEETGFLVIKAQGRK